MSAHPFSALLLGLLLLAPFAAGDEPPTYAPYRVVTWQAEGTAEAVVSWQPGEVPAEAYRVYGLTDGVPVLLFDSAALPGAVAAVVPGGFERYGVAGVVDGAESALVYGILTDEGEPCIYVRVSTDPAFSICKVGSLAKFRGVA